MQVIFFFICFAAGVFFGGFFCVDSVDFVLEAHFEYVDAYMVRKNALRRPSGDSPGTPAGDRTTASGTDAYFTPWSTCMWC